MRRFPFVALVLVAFAAAAQELSLGALLDVPLPSAMTAAPAGGAVAWVQIAGDVRNVWVATTPDYRGRQLTSWAAVDGQAIGNLEWSADGKTLVFVRGGGGNRQGEIPNPTSDPAGQEQVVWRVALAVGEPVRIATGSAPAVSPRGTIAFVQKSVIWAAPLDGSAEPQKLATVRGNPRNLRWSPDGSRLAFVSNRGTHAFIAILDVDANVLRFVDPSVDRDDSPVWSPDGSELAFIRTPAEVVEHAFGPRRSAEPWSIRVADARTGASRPLFTADEGRGSAYQDVVSHDQLQWGAGERIVFPWEKDGWVHLYSVAKSGGTPRLLTPGAFEVEYVALTPDRRHIIYNSNQDDIDRRHLWRVAIDGAGAPAPLTPGRGIEWAAAPLSDGRGIALLRSDARKPAHAAVLIDGRGRELAPGSIPATFPADRLVEPQRVVFAATDGMEIPGQIFVPVNGRPGEKRPAVLFFHGGSRRQMLLGWHYGSYYHNAYAMNQHLASKGYVVLSVNYRSGTGYGMEFREALQYGATGASEFHDVLGAGLYLRSRSDVDPKRIGLWGGSYGGYLTALGLARASDLFAAGVDFHGVHDWNRTIRNFVPEYNTLERPEEARLALASSPLFSLETWRSPVLVIHGDDDRNVPFLETIALVEQLRKRDVEVEQLIFPDEVHGFLLQSNWKRAYTAASEFFDRKLAGR